MICEYCGRILKTAGAYEKHHCKNMDRIAEFNDDAYQLYRMFCIKANMPFREESEDDKLKNRLKFIRSKYFKVFSKMAEFNKENGLTDICAVAETIIHYRLDIHQWCNWASIDRYHEYKKANEPKVTGIARSKEWVQKNNINLLEMTQLALFRAVYYNNITLDYLRSIGVAPEQVFNKDQQIGLGLILP